MVHRLTMLHPIDPRGRKVGGIETHVRLMYERRPADFSVLLVGIDERGDLELGRPVKLQLGDHSVDFLPVARIPDSEIHTAAKKLGQSVTLRFALGALRYLPTIRRLGDAPEATTELQRFELGLIGRLIGRPVVQIVHGEGSRKDKMDSLIRRFWYLNLVNERIALSLASRIVCVNASIIERFKKIAPRLLSKSELLTVSVDMDRFTAAPFPDDDIFRIVFAGRLDSFKDPGLMFQTMRRLHWSLGGKFEFHYVGTSDPHRFPEFQAIAPYTVLHGFQDSAGVAAVLRHCHAGVLTSYFEGMPCFLLELLSSGRPIGAVRLPQFDSLVINGESGFLVDRSESAAETAERLREGFLALRQQMSERKLDPAAIRKKVLPYSTRTQMPRLFDRHRRLARKAAPPRTEALRDGSS
ncbi:glycosyltransferase [Kaistia dalseonensis]|uniref:Glycosyltransferase involved in cell wall biosynthesis n=1 Tax=Kaistia dalseonensis TaxID=410840 RepID=A0ABU0HAP9_9HYPH|nr:glycosyltransferase [Kaistia dalseonensis]MCX5495981.1 glycosyltransferase [Kaistia dalseonensis]MDQ0438584.1 glycosyltransferase involved in cell wall biosynthesis [Kaistia dalseonensis]